MKSAYYTILARSKLAARSRPFRAVRGALAGVPLLDEISVSMKRSAARFLLPRELTWVQVESGFARGLWLLLNLDVEGGFWTGSYESEVQAFLKRACLPGSVFYDVGANLGFFSLGAAKQVGAEGRVFGFEPEPENARRFREITARNGLMDRIAVIEAAAWARRESEITFVRGGRQYTYGGVAADGIRPVLAQGDTRLVKAVSLDDFVSSGHPVPRAIKIDVEGGECQVLKGAREIFSRFKPVLVCEVHHQGAADWIAEWLVEMQYQAAWCIPDELFPRLLFAEASLPGPHGATMRP